MLATLLGVTAAVMLGGADFLAGLAARRVSPLVVTALVALCGFIALAVALPFAGGAWSASAVGLGVASGVTGAVSVSLLYACLAIGPMSILSPLTAVVGAIVPMTWGLLGGEMLGPGGVLGLALALTAVVLVGFLPDRDAARPSLVGVLMATAAGMTGGAFLILLDATPHDSGLVPLILNRASSLVLMSATVAVLWSGPRLAGTRWKRSSRSRPRRDTVVGLRLAIACAALDTGGMVVVLSGLRLGDLSVVSVLSSMYPATTVLLAAAVLRDRVGSLQWVGLGTGIAAVGLLAVAR